MRKQTYLKFLAKKWSWSLKKFDQLSLTREFLKEYNNMITKWSRTGGGRLERIDCISNFHGNWM